MTRKLHSLLLALCLVAVMAGAALAETFTGKVNSVDTAGGKVTVEKLRTFDATPSLLQGIAKGDKVTVTYEKKDGKNEASKVEKK